MPTLSEQTEVKKEVCTNKEEDELKKLRERLSLIRQELGRILCTLIDMLPLEREMENIERIGHLLVTVRDLIQIIEGKYGTGML